VNRVLAELRRDRRLTQADVALALKLSRSYYANIERSRRTPRTADAVRIAQFFGTTVEHLFAPCDVPQCDMDAQLAPEEAIVDGVA